MTKSRNSLFFGAAALAAVLLCTVAAAQFSSVTKEDADRWRKLAELGHANAQFILGGLYEFGGGVAKDEREATRWYRKAAEQGHAEAQLQLGYALGAGAGVAEDKYEAARWYRKAAEQGVAKAQYNLGLALWGGNGVDEDKREAVRWYRRAAEQGMVPAQYNLGWAYFAGQGAIFDAREAFIWLSIAKAGGDEQASEVLQLVNSGRMPWFVLSESETRSAQKEAARRLDEIDHRKAENEKKSSAEYDAATKPKGTNIAERVFEKTWRSVVVVSVNDSQGSGVIVRPNVVATNCHVVDMRGKIKVYKSDNRRADTGAAFSARIRHSDEDKDFCLLDVDGLWGVPATVRKYDTLGIGEDVYGLGAPQGLDLSLSAGVISQLREVNGDRFIQTDTAISPGSSGGGLFDSDGNLIGIMTAKIADESTEGIGFAIPADLVLGH